MNVQVLDSTLREGEQTPGVYFDTHIKLAIAELLDQVGVDFIEAGHPAVDAEIHQAVAQLSAQGLRATICAHSRSLQRDVDEALACGAGFLGIFYCVSNERLTDVFNTDLDTAVRRVAEVIRYAKGIRPDIMVRYTPEDGVRSQFENVAQASLAAVEAGADIISVADTTGHMIPGTERSMYDFVARLRDRLDSQGATPRLAVHCHNDRGLALANALDGLRAGASIVDTSVMGLGERTGIVDLAQLLTVLSQDFGVSQEWNLEKLPDLYGLVARYTGMPIPVTLPVLGKNAFTHCAGVHTHAAAVNPTHYQSVDPGPFGRRMEVSLDHMSGLASIQYALEQLGEEADRPLVEEVLGRVKSIGKRGRTVDLVELRYVLKSCRG